MTNAKLLIVEDDPQMRQGLSDILTEEGYKVSSVSSGKEAIENIKKNGFDVVVTDIVMPGMDGMEVLKEAKRLEPQIHVVMITAFATIENAVEAMKRGASDYIAKPFKIAEVQVAIRRVLEETKFRKMIKEKFVNPTDDSLEADFVIKALSNPIRRGVIELLDRCGKARFTDIRKDLNIDDATKLSFHLRVLRNAGLLKQDEVKTYLPTTMGIKAAEALKLLEESSNLG